MNKVFWPILYVSLAICFALLFVLRGDLFVAMTVEDGWVEWLTTLAYLLAAILFFLSFVRYPRGARVRAWFLLFLACGCFFVAGEEISWGQRVLGLETPEAIARHNFQNEITLHNLGEWGKDGPRRLYVFGVFCFVVILPILYRFSAYIRALADKMGVLVPPFSLMVPFACSLMLTFVGAFNRLFDMGLDLRTDYAAEVMELFSGFVFLHLAVLVRMRGGMPAHERW